MVTTAATLCLEDTGCFGMIIICQKLFVCSWCALVVDVRFKTIPQDFIPYYGMYPLRDEATQLCQLIVTHRTAAPLAFAELVCQVKRHDVIAVETKRLWSFARRPLQATVLRLLAALARAEDAQLDLSLVYYNVVRSFILVLVYFLSVPYEVRTVCQMEGARPQRQPLKRPTQCSLIGSPQHLPSCSARSCAMDYRHTLRCMPLQRRPNGNRARDARAGLDRAPTSPSQRQTDAQAPKDGPNDTKASLGSVRQ